MGRKIPPLAERLMAKVRVEAGGCWTWTGAMTHNGYGKIWSGGEDPKCLRAHRASYEAHVGRVPDGLVLDHLCRNRACVNPAHLEPVSARENLMRGEGTSAVNARRRTCRKGHLLLGENLRMEVSGRRCKQCAKDWKQQKRAKEGA
jgi:hypothetical protein